MSDIFFTIVGMHSNNAPPAVFEIPIGGGACTVEETLESVNEWEIKHPTYTAGYNGNPNHLWRIVDHAVCETKESAKNHQTLGYIIFYYEPVNTEAVIRDCLPHLLPYLNEECRAT